jgi:hypothetical protein
LRGVLEDRERRPDVSVGRIGPRPELLGPFDEHLAPTDVLDPDEDLSEHEARKLLEDQVAEIPIPERRHLVHDSRCHRVDLLFHATDVARAERRLRDVAQLLMARIVHDDEGQDRLELREVVEKHPVGRREYLAFREISLMSS